MVYVALLRGINVGGKNEVDYEAAEGCVRVRSPLHKRMTIRNCNTARKLLELMEA